MTSAPLRPSASEAIPCAICETDNFEIVSSTDRDGRPLRTTLCRTCGLVWTNPRPASGDIEAYYEIGYRLDYKNSSLPSRRKILRGVMNALDRRRTLLPMLRPGMKLLDVGCGAGEFVHLLSASGVDAIGLEPDAQYSQFAKSFGIRAHRGTVRSFNQAPASLDMVTIFHALEHMADPVGTLAHVRSWLRPRGLCVVEVPNVNATCQAPKHRFHYAHLYSFSQRTLAATGKKAGFRTLRSWLSADGGNVTCVFQVSETPFTGGDDTEAYAETKRVLREHTAARHYASLAPLVRAIGRLRRWRSESRLLRVLPTSEAIMKWGEDGTN